MSSQIIKQPDGKYAIWSTGVDTFTVIDCTPEDIIQMWYEEAAQRLREGVLRTVAELEAGGKPYYQFTMTWQEALDMHLEVHGEPFDIDKERAAP